MGLLERIKLAREVAKDGGRLGRRNTAIFRIDMLLVGSVCSWLHEIATRVPDELVDPLMKKMMLKNVVALGPDGADNVHKTILGHETVDTWRKEHWPASPDPIVYRYGALGVAATAILSRPTGQANYTRLILPDTDARVVLEHGQEIEWFPSTIEGRGHLKAAKNARTLLYDNGFLERCPQGAHAWKVFIRDNPEHQAAEFARQYNAAPDPDRS